MIISRRLWWVGHVACMGERRGVYRVWVEKTEGKRARGGCRLRGTGNIKTDFEEIEWKAWTGLI
jgi:guanyl-specific ribonuclease Sa